MKYIDSDDLQDLSRKERFVRRFLYEDLFPENLEDWTLRSSVTMGIPFEAAFFFSICVILAFIGMMTLNPEHHLENETIPLLIFSTGIVIGGFGGYIFTSGFYRLTEKAKEVAREMPLHEIDPDFRLWKEGDRISFPVWSNDFFLHSIGAGGKIVVRTEEDEKSNYQFFDLHSLFNPAMIRNKSLEKRRRSKTSKKKTREAMKVAEEIGGKGYQGAFEEGLPQAA